MNIFYSILIAVVIITAIIIIALIIMSQSSNSGLLASGNERFLPSSMNGLKNKIITIFSIIFFAAILLVGFIGHKEYRNKYNTTIVDEVEAKSWDSKIPLEE